MRQTRRLAAILAADVAGYSRLMGADEEGTLERLKALRRELLDPKIAEHRGRIVKTTGDGLLLEFPSVVDAVRCVVEVQSALAAQAATVPEDRRIALRIGVNIGDVIIDGDDIFGDGVNVAARLQELAAPGGMCVSDFVQQQMRGKVDFALGDMGEQQVKNIAHPVRAWRVEGLGSKDTLNVCYYGKRMSYMRNSPHGIETLLSTVQALAPDLVAIEHSGGFEQPVTEALARTGIAIAVLGQREVTDFARLTGRFANSGGLIDARTLCAYAAQHRFDRHAAAV